MEKKQTLNFIGTGSCFNTEFGNNAAYYEEEQGKRIYYSGDTKTISEKVIREFREGKLDEFYQDVIRQRT